MFLVLLFKWSHKQSLCRLSVEWQCKKKNEIYIYQNCAASYFRIENISNFSTLHVCICAHKFSLKSFLLTHWIFDYLLKLYLGNWIFCRGWIRIFDIQSFMSPIQTDCSFTSNSKFVLCESKNIYKSSSNSERVGKKVNLTIKTDNLNNNITIFTFNSHSTSLFANCSHNSSCMNIMKHS